MDTPLVRADAMREILAHFQVDLNQTNEDGDTLLHTAAGEGNTSMVAALLATGSIDRRDADTRHALHRAAENGYVEIVRLLLNAGGDPNVRDDVDDSTPLHAAASEGHTEVARLLIAAGADIHYEDSSRDTPLVNATYRNCAEVARLLLKSGARFDKKNADGSVLLHLAAANKSNETIKCLLSFGAEVNVVDRAGRTPLYDALEYGTRRTLAVLLGAGAIIDLDLEGGLKDVSRDVESDDDDGLSPASRKLKRRRRCSAWRYFDKVVAAGGYEHLVRTYRRVLTAPRGCLTRYLRQRFGRDVPHDIAARILEFWKPPGGP